MTLLALLACTPPEEAPVEFSDAARYGLEHFDDEATDALSAPLLALEEESYGTLDMAEARTRMLADIDHEAGVTPSRSQERPAGERLPATAEHPDSPEGARP